MNKQLQIVLLIGLVANAYSQYYGAVMNTCPLGQYPGCDASSSGMSGMSTTTSAPASNQSCLVCPKGSAALGSSSYNYYYMYGSSSCQICYSGYYANNTGQISCSQCPEGYNCADPTQSPVPCPKGFACSRVWNTDSNSYYYYYYGQTIVKACPQGTYASKTAQGQCTTCPAGYYCADPTAAPVACPKGTASNPYGYGMYNSGCQQCPQGTYTPSTGSVTCTICPEGSICPDQKSVIKCPAGTYSNRVYKVTFPIQSDSNNYYYYYNIMCRRCPQGYYSAAGAKTCTKCPKGYYCSDPTVSPKRCPAGTFSNMEYGVQSCIRCPPGTYQTSTAGKQCLNCPKGSYCADPARSPIKCPIGTFSNSTYGQPLCTPCPPGTYAATTGLSQCLPCPANKCCNNPTISPQPCYFPSTSTPSFQYSTYFG